MAQIEGFLTSHPLWAASSTTPSWIPFDSPPRTPKPYVSLSTIPGGNTQAGPADPPLPANQIRGFYNENFQLSPWFEMPHLAPTTIDEGRILSTVSIGISIHNAYRRTSLIWNSVVNGAGAGSELTGPTPPELIAPQGGISNQDLVFVISTDGVPVVDDTLDFGFDDGSLLQISVAFTRLVFFDIFPEAGIQEVLGFLTEILMAKDGTEQRHALRRFPRQKFRVEFRQENTDMTRLLNLLNGRQGSVYGLPLWHESCVLSQAATALDTVLNVDSTAFRDFRNGGTAVVFTSREFNDILTIDSFTGTTITLVNPLVNSYPAGTLVMPVRLATTGPRQSGSRWPRRLTRLAVEFIVEDIDVDLADTSGWGMLNGKVLVDDGNAIRGTVNEGIEASLVTLDPQIGVRKMFSFAPTGRYVSTKTWFAQGIEYLWEIRQLLHAFRGRQTSFYLPADRDNLNVTADIGTGVSLFVIDNASLSHVVGTTTYEFARFTEIDGTKTTVEMDTVEVSEDQLTETVNIVGTFPATILAANIIRCELIQKVRFDTDNFTINYEPGRPGARISAPIRTVLD